MTTCQGWDCPQQDGLSHINHRSRKCPHRLAYGSLWFSPLLEWHSIFSYSLCQVDKNQLAQRVRKEWVPTNGWKLPIEKQWLPKSFQPLFGQCTCAYKLLCLLSETESCEVSYADLDLLCPSSLTPDTHTSTSQLLGYRHVQPSSATHPPLVCLASPIFLSLGLHNP